MCPQNVLVTDRHTNVKLEDSTLDQPVTNFNTPLKILLILSDEIIEMAIRTKSIKFYSLNYNTKLLLRYDR